VTTVSARTAELALRVLQQAVEHAQARRNGTLIPDHVRVAFIELGAAARAGDSATGTEIDSPQSAVTPYELVDVTTAATRLGITPRAVRKRCERDQLPARRIGRRAWLIEWRRDEWQRQPPGTG
jgi:hypothetical protein